MMNNAIETAKQYVNGNNYENAISLARKNHGNDNVEDYLAILDLLIDANYLPAIEEKGIYYQHYDESHDNMIMVRNILIDICKSSQIL